MDAVQGVVVRPTTDVVGYGKHGEMSYQDLWDNQPVYCLWTVNKFKELVKDGDELETKWVEGDSKLKRLAQWITEVNERNAAIEPEFECDSDMEMVEVERPETETLEKRCAKLQEEGSKFYGVAKPPEHAGVYTSWPECKPHVFGIKGVMYKSFSTQEDAEEYVRNPPLKKSETPEAIAARQAAADAKEAKAAEAKAAREEAKVAKEKAKEEAKAAKEDAKAAKAAAKQEAKAVKEAAAKDAKVEKSEAVKRKADGAGETVAESDTKSKRRKSVESKADGDADKAAKPKKIVGKLAKSTQAKVGAAKATAKAKAKAKLAVKKASLKAKAAKAKDVAKSEKPASASNVPSTDGAASATAKKAKSPKAKEPVAAVESRIKSTGSKASAKQAPEATPSSISSAVLERADSLGMKTALQNLAARAEIVSQKFSAETLLETLIKADGLVNKAKSMLISPSSASPAAPAPVAQLETPEKVEKHESCNFAGLAETLSAFSQTLRMVSAPKEEAAVKPEKPSEKPSGLSDEQLQRIKENRERALARKSQQCGS